MDKDGGFMGIEATVNWLTWNGIDDPFSSVSYPFSSRKTAAGPLCWSRKLLWIKRGKDIYSLICGLLPAVWLGEMGSHIASWEILDMVPALDQTESLWDIMGVNLNIKGKVLP